MVDDVSVKCSELLFLSCFDDFYWKKNTPFNWIQLRSMKGKESWTSYDFTMKNSQEWKQISNGDCLHFFSIWKAVEHLAKFFQHYHQDAFMLIAIQNPFRLLIFSCVLISDKIERILKKKFLWYHSSYTCTCIRKTFSFHTEEKMIKSFKLD